MAEREDKLKAARDKLEKFRKKKQKKDDIEPSSTDDNVPMSSGGLASYFNPESGASERFQVPGGNEGFQVESSPELSYFSRPGLGHQESSFVTLSSGNPREICPDISSVFSGAVVNQIDQSMFMVPAPGVEMNPAPGSEMNQAPGSEMNQAPGAEMNQAPGAEMNPASGVEMYTALEQEKNRDQVQFYLQESDRSTYFSCSSQDYLQHRYQGNQAYQEHQAQHEHQDHQAYQEHQKMQNYQELEDHQAYQAHQDKPAYEEHQNFSFSNLKSSENPEYTPIPRYQDSTSHVHSSSVPSPTSALSSNPTIISPQTLNPQFESFPLSGTSNTSTELAELKEKISELEVRSQLDKQEIIRLHDNLEQMTAEQHEKEQLKAQLIAEQYKREQCEACLEQLRQEQAETKARMSSETRDITELKEELIMKTNTIQLIIAEKSELQSKASYLEQQCSLLLQEKDLMNAELSGFKVQNSELKTRIGESSSTNKQVEDLIAKLEKVEESLEDKNIENNELQGKLRRMCEENEKDKSLLRKLTSELEINKVHLIQLRGTGGGEVFTQEIQNLNSELQTTRNSLAEALGSRDKLAADKEKLAEQYRNYSKDLAMQAERLSEQLRRHQDENARLVHRESGLVGQIEQMEKQMQKYVQGGKNVTEEENSALKDRCSALESELRQARELYNKLEEMYSERSAQVEDILKRLSQREGKINELQGMVSRLETTNEMLRTDSGLERNKAELLASMESDKVAASRALQQNSKLKQEIEELQQELVNLINSKAELLDRLEDFKRQVEKLSSSDSQIKGLQESLRERDVVISSMKNQIKYLESVSQPENSLSEYNNATVGTDLKQLELTQADLQRATEEIRGLHSINSELRSQLEVLSSRTRECSESRSPSSRTGQESRSRSPSSSSDSSDHGNSTLSISSDSFIQVDKMKSSSSSPPSSDNSFINLPKVSSGDLTKSVDVTNGIPAILTDQHGAKVSSPVDNLEAWRQLENRFISAMNTVASLSSDKDQLEHLVTRLQEETDTIADYIVMYQHQRKQQKMKIQEKDDQLQQLARDKTNLQNKLTDLHALVNQVMKNKPKESHTEDGVEAVEAAEASEISPAEDTSRIYELLTEIQADSDHMVSNLENFKPWFFSPESNTSRVITV